MRGDIDIKLAQQNTMKAFLDKVGSFDLAVSTKRNLITALESLIDWRSALGHRLQGYTLNETAADLQYKSEMLVKAPSGVPIAAFNGSLEVLKAMKKTWRKQHIMEKQRTTMTDNPDGDCLVRDFTVVRDTVANIFSDLQQLWRERTRKSKLSIREAQRVRNMVFTYFQLASMPVCKKKGTVY